MILNQFINEKLEYKISKKQKLLIPDFSKKLKDRMKLEYLLKSFQDN